MAKPQIQYSPIAEPPAFTPPTTDAAGWRPSYPLGRDLRRAALTGAILAGCYFADTKTPAAATVTIPTVQAPDTARPVADRLRAQRPFVFYTSAPEPWTVPGRADAEVPDSPRQFIARRLPVAAIPSFAYDSAVEPWVVTPGAGYEGPDNPQQFISRRLREYPAFHATFALEQASIPPNSWGPSYPDRPVRAKGLIEHPASIWPSTSITIAPAPPNSWGPQYPDRVWAASRLREYPSRADTILAPFGVTTGWDPQAPARVWAATRAREYPSLSLAMGTAGAVVVGWLPSTPDRVAPPARRRQTDPAQVFGLEQFAPPSVSVWAFRAHERPVRAKRLGEYPAHARAVTTFSASTLDQLTWRPIDGIWARRPTRTAVTASLPGCNAAAVLPNNVEASVSVTFDVETTCVVTFELDTP
jgi:hypothetical protein